MDFSRYGYWYYTGQLCPKHRTCPAKGKIRRCLCSHRYVQSSRNTFVLITELSPAVGLLVMMYPILCKIRFESLHHIFREKGIWVQMAFSIVLNWIIAPFLMVSYSNSSVAEILTDLVSLAGLGVGIFAR